MREKNGVWVKGHHKIDNLEWVWCRGILFLFHGIFVLLRWWFQFVIWECEISMYTDNLIEYKKNCIYDTIVIWLAVVIFEALYLDDINQRCLISYLFLYKHCILGFQYRGFYWYWLMIWTFFWYPARRDYILSWMYTDCLKFAWNSGGMFRNIFEWW